MSHARWIPPKSGNYHHSGNGGEKGSAGVRASEITRDRRRFRTAPTSPNSAAERARFSFLYLLSSRLRHRSALPAPSCACARARGHVQRLCSNCALGRIKPNLERLSVISRENFPCAYRVRFRSEARRRLIGLFLTNARVQFVHNYSSGDSTDCQTNTLYNCANCAWWRKRRFRLSAV